MNPQTKLPQSRNFEVECALGDSGRTLLCRPVGEITEVADLKPLQERIQSLRGKIDVIRFDLGDVSRINSYGVKNWLIMLRSIPEVVRTEFERVSETLMDQAIILPDFLGRDIDRVKSFFAPFRCKKCNKPSAQLISMPEFRQDTSIVDRKFHCPACKSTLSFDGLIDEYDTLIHVKKPGM